LIFEKQNSLAGQLRPTSRLELIRRDGDTSIYTDAGLANTVKSDRFDWRISEETPGRVNAAETLLSSIHVELFVIVQST
jgi:hypothetical protein